jgi:hypothetical protein
MEVSAYVFTHHVLSIDAKNLTSKLSLQLVNGLALQNKQMWTMCCQTLKTLDVICSQTLRCLLVETINSMGVAALLLIRELWVSVI